MLTLWCVRPRGPAVVRREFWRAALPDGSAEARVTIDGIITGSSVLDEAPHEPPRALARAQPDGTRNAPATSREGSLFGHVNIAHSWVRQSAVPERPLMTLMKLW